MLKTNKHIRLKINTMFPRLADLWIFILTEFAGYETWDILCIPNEKGDFRYGLTCTVGYELIDHIKKKNTNDKWEEMLKKTDFNPFEHFYYEIEEIGRNAEVSFFTNNQKDIASIILWCKEMKKHTFPRHPFPLFVHLPFKMKNDKGFIYTFSRNQVPFPYRLVAENENEYIKYYTNNVKNLLKKAERLKNHRLKFYNTITLNHMNISYMNKKLKEIYNMIGNLSKEFENEKIILIFRM